MRWWRVWFVILLLQVCTACGIFYDEGARFADQVANFAAAFRESGKTTAEFDYTPMYGSRQRVQYGIGRIQWCPQPPCNSQGAARVIVERGKSGTGYRIAAEASVPQPLQVEKANGPVRVFMRRNGAEVEIVALR